MLTLEFLNARHGDACLVLWGQNRAMLVDGGPSVTYDEAIRPRLQRMGPDALLDVVCVSHVDDDHIGGILRLLNDVSRANACGESAVASVARLWFNELSDLVDVVAPGLAATVAGLPATADPAAAIGASYRQARELQRLSTLLHLNGNDPFGGLVRRGATASIHDLKVTVITPGAPELAGLATKWLEAEQRQSADVIAAAIRDRSVPNLSSISLHVQHGAGTALLTGDALGDHIIAGLSSARLLHSNQPLHVDVLKVPHHGSAKNVSAAFFSQIYANHYVISADGRKHDHPDQKTLEWLVASRLPTDRYTIHLTNPITPAIERLRTLQHGRAFKVEANAISGASVLITLAD